MREALLRDNILSKFLDDKAVSPAERRRAAIEKWQRVEILNRKTNTRLYLDQYDHDFGWCTSDQLLSAVRSQVSSILGKLPSLRRLRGSITNGATTRVKRSYLARYEKICGSMHCSSSALPAWINFASGTPFGGFRGEGDITLSEHSVLLTVPKKTEIDRVIAKEPDCNALLQRMYGLYLSDRLKRVGIDLSTQSKNQRMAREGSITGGLATIDFSSASDTLSRQLVLLVLPSEWYEVLDALRVKETQLDGSTIELELFSSMGNGFTFELETVVFYSIARAVQRLSNKTGPVTVYGDDVIVPTSIAKRYMRICRWLGFIPNLDKSFTKGWLRESCGKFYHRGTDVTPFFIRGEIRTVHSLINVLNQLTKWSCDGWGFYQDARLYAFWQNWSRFVPSIVRGGHSIDDPSALVNGSRGSHHLVPVTRTKRMDDSPLGLLLSLWLGGEYSLATEDLRRHKVGRLSWSHGTCTYDPGLLFSN
jgi:hypothetical protein